VAQRLAPWATGTGDADAICRTPSPRIRPSSRSKLAREQAARGAYGHPASEAPNRCTAIPGYAAKAFRKGRGRRGSESNYSGQSGSVVGWAAGGRDRIFGTRAGDTARHLDGEHLARSGAALGRAYDLGTASYGGSKTRHPHHHGHRSSETATGSVASNQIGGRLAGGFRHPVDRMRRSRHCGGLPGNCGRTVYRRPEYAGGRGSSRPSSGAPRSSSLTTSWGSGRDAYVLGNARSEAPFGRVHGA